MSYKAMHKPTFKTTWKVTEIIFWQSLQGYVPYLLVSCLVLLPERGLVLSETWKGGFWPNPSFRKEQTLFFVCYTREKVNWVNVKSYIKLIIPGFNSRAAPLVHNILRYRDFCFAPVCSNKSNKHNHTFNSVKIDENMKKNYFTVITGAKVVLVSYKKEHVAK